MLVIGRVFLINLDLLIFDEVIEGLVLFICREIWDVICKIKEIGVLIIIVDKNIKVL